MTPATRTAGSCPAKPRDHGGGRLGLAGRIHDEENRQAIAGGKVGGGAAPASRSGQAVEQAHRTLDQHEVGIGRQIGEDRVEERRTHRPGVEVDAVGAGRRGMEGRVDVVRPGLGRADPDPAAAEARGAGRR